MSNHTEQVIDEIKAERVRQQSAEGWTEEHDDEHGDGSLATSEYFHKEADKEARS